MTWIPLRFLLPITPLYLKHNRSRPGIIPASAPDKFPLHRIGAASPIDCTEGNWRMSLIGDLGTRKKLEKTSRRSRRVRLALGGSLKPDLGCITQRVEHAQEQVRRNIFRVAVHNGSNTRARGSGQSRNLAMRKPLSLHHLDNFRVQVAPQFDFPPAAGVSPSAFASSEALRVTIALDFFIE